MANFSLRGPVVIASAFEESFTDEPCGKATPEIPARRSRCQAQAENQAPRDQGYFERRYT
jgi:hypothetical protein